MSDNRACEPCYYPKYCLGWKCRQLQRQVHGRHDYCIECRRFHNKCRNWVDCSECGSTIPGLMYSEAPAYPTCEKCEGECECE